MKHRLFTIAAGVSLLLWLVAMTSWIRSYFVADSMCYYSRGADEPGDHGDLLDEREIISRNGHILFEYARSDNRMPSNDDATEQPTLPLRPFIRLWRSTPRRIRGALVDGVDRGEFTTTLPKRWGGFASGEEDYRGNHAESNLIYFSAPYWPLVLTLTPLPLLAMQRRRRHCRRRRSGLCLTCGYDLRASIDRCPECGMILMRKGTGDPCAADRWKNQATLQPGRCS